MESAHDKRTQRRNGIKKDPERRKNKSQVQRMMKKKEIGNIEHIYHIPGAIIKNRWENFVDHQTTPNDSNPR